MYEGFKKSRNMSSIYKKGRDGYYYYQAYVYNSDSNKKDKRVFHALRTKDLLEAKTKQNELDLQYEKRIQSDSDSKRLSYNIKLKPTIAIVILTIAVTVLVVESFFPKTVNQNTSGFIIPEKNEVLDIKNNAMPEFEPEKPIIEKTSAQKNLVPEPKQKTSKTTIPKYTIERVDKLSDSFGQGKVYVTIDENSSKDSQHLLCSSLMKQYNEFSNIIICLYSNNRAGKDLAKGNDENISIEEQKRSWLAMYTYNSVEGEYFDDNPSRYIGVY